MTTANNVFPNGPSEPPSAAALYAMLVELDQFRALPGFAVDYKRATFALLDAEDPAEGETGYVYGDSDPEKNGTYVYSVGPGWIFQGVTEQQLREAADAELSQDLTDAINSLLDDVDSDGNTLAKLKALVDEALSPESIAGSEAKTGPEDNDLLALIDSADSNALKKVTLASIRTSVLVDTLSAQDRHRLRGGERHIGGQTFNGVTQNADYVRTGPQFSDERTTIKASPTDWPNGVRVVVPIRSGTFSSATLTQQEDDGTETVAAVNMTIVSGDEAFIEIEELNAATEQLYVRVRGAAGGVVYEAPMLLEPGTVALKLDEYWGDAKTRAVEAYLASRSEQPNVAMPFFGASTSATYDDGGPATVSGYRLTIPAGGTVGSGRMNISALAELDDHILLIFSMSRPNTNGYPSLNVYHNTAGGGFNIPDQEITSLGGGLVAIRAWNLRGSTGLPPVELQLSVDDRNSDAGDDDFVATIQYMAFGASMPTFPARVNTDAQTIFAISQSGFLKRYVDPSASANGNGTAGQPFQTVAEAYAAGASHIALRAGSASTVHRVTSALGIVRDVTFSTWRQAGDARKRALLAGSTSIAPGDWTATGGSYPNLYEITSADVGRVWEVSASGAISPMGVAAATGKLIEAASLSEANSTVGSYIFTGGKLYIRPFGDALSGKTWEKPIAANVISISGGAVASLDQIEARFGTDTIAVGVGTLRTNDCLIGSSATYNVINLADGARWEDTGVSSTIEDASNDGCGTNPSTLGIDVHLGETLFRNNISDGLAFHGTNNRLKTRAARYENNGKLGFTSIGGGTFDLGADSATGNYTGQFDFEAGTGITMAVTLSKSSGSVNLRLTGGTINATVKDHRGPIQSAATTLDVDGHVVRGSAAHGLRVNGGAATLSRFKYTKCVTGLQLTGGTLAAKEGNILRNTTGISQTGGTLTLDADDPVNVFGNGSQFSGVSAPDQAKTVAVAAV